MIPEARSLSRKTAASATSTWVILRPRGPRSACARRIALNPGGLRAGSVACGPAASALRTPGVWRGSAAMRAVDRDGSESAFGESAVAVHRKYLQFGLDLSERVSGEPPDHISFELEFMHNLCSKEADAWDGDNEEEALGMMRAEKEFLREHLLAWLPKFCNKIREYDRLGFFRELADLTEGWVAFDYQQHLQGKPLSSTAGITEG